MINKNKAWRIIFLLFLAVVPVISYLVFSLYPVQAIACIYKISPGCIFHDLTGIKCPGCGGTRAMTSLIDGNWAKAVSYNVFWIPTIFILLVEYANAWLMVFHASLKYRRWVGFRLFVLKAYAVILLVFVVARNIFDF